MFDNSSKELTKKFRKNPTKYVKDFENYMLGVLDEKLGENTKNMTIAQIIKCMETKYPNFQKSCEVLYLYFCVFDGLDLNQDAEKLIQAISEIENI